MREAVNRKLTATAALVLLSLLPCGSWAGPAGENLLRAVRSGDLAAARALLARRTDPNHRLPDGSTPLSWAVDSQDGKMVRLLLDGGAKPDGAGVTTVSALSIGCERGDPAILTLLLDAGANVAVARPDGIAPLSLCAGNTAAAVVERLLAGGAEIDKPDSKGQTALMWAAAHGRIDNIRLLVARGAQVNRVTDKGFTPLFFALKSGEPLAPVALLEAGANPDYVAPDGTSVVQLAIYQKNYDFAARLIERGADLQAWDRNGNQLLHAAVLAEQPSLISLLLAKGADPDALTGPSKVTWRYEVNFTSARYEVPAKSPLLLAAERGSAGIMKLLLDAGGSSGFRADDGTNVVLAASTSGKLAALQLALQLAPDPNVTTVDGLTPLHRLLGCEVGTDTAAMMKLLADKGARIDIKSRDGVTPLDVTKDAPAGVKELFATTFQTRTGRTTHASAAL